MTDPWEKNDQAYANYAESPGLNVSIWDGGLTAWDGGDTQWDEGLAGQAWGDGSAISNTWA